MLLISRLDKKNLSDFPAVYNHVCPVSTTQLFLCTTVRVTPRTSSSHMFMSHSRTSRRTSKHAENPTEPSLYNARDPGLKQPSRLLVCSPTVAIRISSRRMLVAKARKQYISLSLDRNSTQPPRIYDPETQRHLTFYLFSSPALSLISFVCIGI